MNKNPKANPIRIAGARVLLATILIGFAAAAEEKASHFVIPEETQILLENHCLDCHGHGAASHHPGRVETLPLLS